MSTYDQVNARLVHFLSEKHTFNLCKQCKFAFTYEIHFRYVSVGLISCNLCKLSYISKSDLFKAIVIVGILEELMLRFI